MFSGGGAVLDRRANGTATLKDLAVFRAGTFTAADGTRAKWTTEHLDAMVSNFNELGKSVLKNVPWRTNHPDPKRRDVNEVVGYFADLRRDGDTLFADVDLTEPDAVDKWERGTYRERSIELGAYKTPNGDTRWPVVTGSAFVDRGAVSFSAPDEEDNQTATYFMENTMADDQTNPGSEDDENASTGDENENQETEGGGSEEASTDDSGSEASEANPESQHSAQFSWNGKTFGQAEFSAFMTAFTEQSTQFAALQAAMGEQAKARRHEFVDSLVAGDQMFQAKRDEAIKFVDGLTDAQFNEWQALQADAPKIGLFQDHVQVDVSASNAPDTVQQFMEREGVLQETINFMARTMPQDQIEQSDPWKELQEIRTSNKEGK